MTAFQAIIAVLEKYTGEKITSALVRGFEGDETSGRLVFPYHGEGISVGCYSGNVMLTYRGVTRHYQVREVFGQIAVKEM